MNRRLLMLAAIVILVSTTASAALTVNLSANPKSWMGACNNKIVLTATSAGGATSSTSYQFTWSRNPGGPVGGMTTASPSNAYPWIPIYTGQYLLKVTAVNGLEIATEEIEYVVAFPDVQVTATPATGVTQATTVSIQASKPATCLERFDVVSYKIEVRRQLPDGTAEAWKVLSDWSTTRSAMTFVPWGDGSYSIQVREGIFAGKALLTEGAKELAPIAVNTPFVLTGLDLAPATVTGTKPVTGTVTVSKAAPAGGATVQLSGSTWEMTLPPSVVIPAGQRSATFPITTRSATTPKTPFARATLGTSERSVTLTVVPPKLVSFIRSVGQSDPIVIVGGAGNQSFGKFMIDVPAPGENCGTSNLTIQEVSGNEALIPSRPVGFQCGSTTSFDQTLNGQADVQAETTFNMTYGSGAEAIVIPVKVIPFGVLKVGVGDHWANTRTIAGGSTFQGLIALNGLAPAAGYTVPLSSSDPNVIVPASVTVAGGSSYTFINMIQTRGVTSDVTATITAGQPPATVASATVILKAPVLSALALRPPQSAAVATASIVGGGTMRGEVSLDATAPQEGFVVPLSSSDFAATVPATVTVPTSSYGGQFQGAFDIPTMTVDRDTTVTITAGQGAGAKTVTLNVMPVRPDQVTINSQTVAAGNPIGATVLLNSSVQMGTLNVPLSSSDPNVATVPASVDVLTGHGSASFTISTSLVTTPTQVTITAGTGTSARSATVTVTPLGVNQITLTPQSLTGGGTINGTVYLNGAAPAGGFVLPLSSSIAAAAVPASLTFAQGQSWLSFQIPTTAVTADTPGVITAGVKSVNIVIRP